MRVRVAGTEAFITVKGLTVGAARQEFEYPIPLADAERMLDSLFEEPIIEKTRRRVSHDAVTFEIDEFHGANEGLVVAEVDSRMRVSHSLVRRGWAAR